MDRLKTILRYALIMAVCFFSEFPGSMQVNRENS